MAQHFLLSSAARSLSLATVARMSDEEAWNAFRLIRWSDTQGEPDCPRCGCLDSYTYKTRKVFRCKGCSHQFTVTSGTIFASRKLPIRDYLLAIAIFVNGAKGHSALQLSRDLDCQYKSAYVMAHKIREAIAADADEQKATGEVEIDGGYFGGYVKPANRKENRAIAGSPKTSPASAASWSSCASATAGRCPSCHVRRRGGPDDPRPRRRWQHNPCRRSRALGCIARALSHEADQSLGSVLGWGSLHQSSREFL